MPGLAITAFILIDCIKIDVNLTMHQLKEQTTKGMAMTNHVALFASEAPPRAKSTNYPAPFAARVDGRLKRPLGDLFGLRNFGVNLTRLAPGAASSLHHRHSRQDEFIYIVEGEATLFTDDGATTLRPGMVMGFPAGGTAHHLENRGERDCVFSKSAIARQATKCATRPTTFRPCSGKKAAGILPTRTARRIRCARFGRT